jgi:hypothetical protein
MYKKGNFYLYMSYICYIFTETNLKRYDYEKDN